MNKPSKALKVNMEKHKVDVKIRKEHKILEEILKDLRGVHDRLKIFLKELNHPYKNWLFIIKEARTFALDYFHLIKIHEHGPEAASRYINIFWDAFHQTRDLPVRIDSVDNLLVYLQKIIFDANEDLSKFQPVIVSAIEHIVSLNEPQFFYFVKSYYQLDRLADKLLMRAQIFPFENINQLLIRFFQRTYDYWLSVKSPIDYFSQQIESKEDLELIKPLLTKISHDAIQAQKDQLSSLMQEYSIDERKLTEKLVRLSGFNKIVSAYNTLPGKLSRKAPNEQTGKQWKMIFLFHMMSI